MTPSPVDTLCASQANGLSPCSAAPFLSCRQAPSPLHTQPHTPPHTHTYSHTNTHNLPCYSNTPHTPSLTLTYSSHTLIHHSDTPHILQTHTYTLFTPSHTQIHKHFMHCTFLSSITELRMQGYFGTNITYLTVNIFDGSTSKSLEK